MTASQSQPDHRRRAKASFAWRIVRRVILVFRGLHREQVYAWELYLQANRAQPEPRTGPLEWVRTLEGYQLAGNHLADPAGHAFDS